jgi:GRASP55/65 PDZ-like domain
MISSESTITQPFTVLKYHQSTLREVVLVPNRKWGGEGLLGCGVGYGLLHRIPPQPMNPEAMDTILKQNLPYDEQNPFDEQPRKEDLDSSTLFVPADDENFEFGGVSGLPKGFAEEQSRSPHEDFDETPVAHWHSVNALTQNKPHQHNSGASPVDRGRERHGHTHDHEGGDHSHSHSTPQQPHSHSHSPTNHSQPHSHSDSPSQPAPPTIPSSRRTDSVSSLKSHPPLSPPPRASTPTQSGVPTLSHTFAYREARSSFNGVIKPEPLRRLSSPPAANAVPSSSSRQRMRGGIVHSPAGSGAGTPTRVKSPDASVPGSASGAPHIHDDHDNEDGSDSTSKRPGSAEGSITSVD